MVRPPLLSRFRYSAAHLTTSVLYDVIPSTVVFLLFPLPRCEAHGGRYSGRNVEVAERLW